MSADSANARLDVIARHWAKPGTINQVRAILVSLIPHSRAERGCLKYELFENLADPTEFTFIETFASNDALTLHASAPYISGLAGRLDGLIARPSEVQRYRRVETAGA